MKKAIIFLLLLFIPFIAKAEVKISSAELVESTEGLEAEKNPSFEGTEINFDLKFGEINDFVKYKLVISNDTQKDYEISTGETLNEDDYIKYVAETGDENILKAGEEKVLYLTATYNKEVPVSAYVDGVYTSTKALGINLVNEEKNPDTKVGYYVLTIAVILFLSILFIIFTKQKLEFLRVVIIMVGVALPLSIYALEQLTIKINAKVEIQASFHDIRYLKCEFGEYAEYGLVSDQRLLDKTYLVRNNMRIHYVSEEMEEFLKLNPTYTSGDWNWGSYGYILKPSFLTCINKKEYIARTAREMSEEDEAKYNDYWTNFNACINEGDYIIAENTSYDDSPLLEKPDTAIYYYNDCVWRD